MTISIWQVVTELQNLKFFLLGYRMAIGIPFTFARFSSFRFAVGLVKTILTNVACGGCVGHDVGDHLSDATAFLFSFGVAFSVGDFVIRFPVAKVHYVLCGVIMVIVLFNSWQPAAFDISLCNRK